MNRLIIVGSPRIEGRSARLANQLFEACIEECPEDELALVPVSEVNVAGCTGCGVCARLVAGENLEDAQAACGLSELPDEGQEAAAGDAADSGDATGEASGNATGNATGDTEPEGSKAAAAPKSKQAAQFDHPRRCSIDDDMGDIYELIDDAEELTVVSPVYFSGPPSQLKALLDRLQPYYEQTAAERAAAAAEGRTFRTGVKPAVLHVVGEGSDPHGFASLVTIVQSALAVAGFRLVTVLDWVGKIAPDGEILEEADVIDLLSEEEGEDVLADVSVVFGEEGEDVYEGSFGTDMDFDAGLSEGSDEKFDEGFDGYVEEGFEDAAPTRPRLRLNDEQVKERGRASAEAGRSGGKKGRTDKRSSKGGTQTNNRNPRKENQAKSRKRNSKGGKRRSR